MFPVQRFDNSPALSLVNSHSNGLILHIPPLFFPNSGTADDDNEEKPSVLKPRITGLPELVRVGQILDLSCLIPGDSPLKWYRNGELVDMSYALETGDGADNAGLASRNRYSFGVLSEDDGAEYRCEAALDDTHVVSDQISLVVSADEEGA